MFFFCVALYISLQIDTHIEILLEGRVGIVELCLGRMYYYIVRMRM